VAVLYAATLREAHAEDVRLHGMSDLNYVVGYAAFYLTYMMVLRQLTGEYV
jgi:hypothetical protein